MNVDTTMSSTIEDGTVGNTTGTAAAVDCEERNTTSNGRADESNSIDEERGDSTTDEEDDSDDVTVIVLEHSADEDEAIGTNWVDQDSPEMRERRRNVLLRELQRVQRARYVKNYNKNSERGEKKTLRDDIIASHPVTNFGRMFISSHLYFQFHPFHDFVPHTDLFVVHRHRDRVGRRRGMRERRHYVRKGTKDFHQRLYHTMRM